MPINIYGLKCDHCDYKDDSIPFSEYPQNIGKSCPICGENLLTQKEYEECGRMYLVVERTEKILSILRWLNPAHYWRLMFGDRRKEKQITMSFPKRNNTNKEE